jgi:hypothetical protein
VIDRILDERARHRIVTSERSESAARAQRERGVVPTTSQLRARRGDQLVDVAVRVAAIHISFAVRAGVELSARECRTLEVEHSVSSDAAAERAHGAHDHRLREVSLGQASTASRRRGSRQDRDRLRRARRFPRARAMCVRRLARRCPRQRDENDKTGDAGSARNEQQGRTESSGGAGKLTRCTSLPA